MNTDIKKAQVLQANLQKVFQALAGAIAVCERGNRDVQRRLSWMQSEIRGMQRAESRVSEDPDLFSEETNAERFQARQAERRNQKVVMNGQEE